MDYRVILYHKQATSARTRFLRLQNSSVCLFDPIPMPAALLDRVESNTINHPASILQDAERRLDFPAGCLKAEGEYRHTVEVPGQTIQVILAAITTVDPPFAEAEKNGAGFIDLTQARGLPEIELQLLRCAYELVLGG
ncbi:hypothetical protein [Candidatus Thiodiazotropha sp. CDECU1]|uniref:hypothetical protein n=1 Tax=Candidatus Thiodiazotropha sp. CDECU1 TaxID=3065865 RepID=UPI0029301897|nr:hypothetical protein [Candidatus Thiodiazotropha sp. CDECU1]